MCFIAVSKMCFLGDLAGTHLGPVSKGIVGPDVSPLVTIRLPARHLVGPGVCLSYRRL